jgi:hypothetical protein
VLTHYVVGLVVELGEHLGTVVQLGFLAQLGQVPAEHHEVGLGGEQIRFGDGADQPTVPVAYELPAGNLLQVRVGDVGEPEVLAFVGEGEFDHTHGQAARRRECARPFEEFASVQPVIAHGRLLYFFLAFAASSAYAGLVSASMNATRSSISFSERFNGRMPPLR